MQTSERARHRLQAVATATASGPEPDPASDPDLVGPLPAARGWRARWLPVSWRGARAEPGRRGAVALGAVAVAAAVLAAAGVWRDTPVPEPVPALPAVAVDLPLAVPPANDGPAEPSEIVVSVVGTVTAPGLVTLPAGARVADALAAAGGAVPGTDLLTLNLAQVLTDGEQVVVGLAGAPVSGPAPGSGTAGSAPSGGASGTAGLVDLNTASGAELEELPGVGPVMAQAIVDWRTENGGFVSVEQLTEVTGIGDVRFAQLRDLVAVRARRHPSGPCSTSASSRRRCWRGGPCSSVSWADGRWVSGWQRAAPCSPRCWPSGTGTGCGRPRCWRGWWCWWVTRQRPRCAPTRCRPAR